MKITLESTEKKYRYAEGLNQRTWDSAKFACMLSYPSIQEARNDEK